MQGVRADPRRPAQRLGSRGMHEVYLAGSLGARTGHRDQAKKIGGTTEDSGSMSMLCVYTRWGAVNGMSVL